MSLCLTSAQKPTGASSKSDSSRGVFGTIEKTPYRMRRTILVGLRVSRPFGTCALRALNPGVETPGYSRLSLRDVELACSMATTIMDRRTTACPQNPLLSRAPESEKALEPGAWAHQA